MEKKRVVPVWMSVILLLLCVVCAVSVIAMLAYILDNNISTIITSVFCLCAVVLAVVYCFMGYKKNAAKFLVAFSAALAVLVLLQANHYMLSQSNQQNLSKNSIVEASEVIPSEDVINPTDGMPASGDEDLAPVEENPVPAEETSSYSSFINSIGISDKLTMTILIFGMLFTLTVAKDLGKKKSYWLIGIAIALSLVIVVKAVLRAFSGFNNAAFTLGTFNAGICIEFSIFILCVIYGIMIYAKYQDKEARGTK